jgi:hypothetical protein
MMTESLVRKRVFIDREKTPWYTSIVKMGVYALIKDSLCPSG